MHVSQVPPEEIKSEREIETFDENWLKELPADHIRMVFIANTTSEVK